MAKKKLGALFAGLAQTASQVASTLEDRRTRQVAHDQALSDKQDETINTALDAIDKARLDSQTARMATREAETATRNAAANSKKAESVKAKPEDPEKKYRALYMEGKDAEVPKRYRQKFQLEEQDASLKVQSSKAKLDGSKSEKAGKADPNALSEKTLKNKWLGMDDEEKSAFDFDYKTFATTQRAQVGEIPIEEGLPPGSTANGVQSGAAAGAGMAPTTPQTGNPGIDALNFYATGQHLPADVTRPLVNDPGLDSGSNKNLNSMAHLLDNTKTITGQGYNPPGKPIITDKSVEMAQVVDPHGRFKPLSDVETAQLELLKKVNAGTATKEERALLDELIAREAQGAGQQ